MSTPSSVSRALVDRRTERVEGGERSPLVVRHEQPDVLESVGEAASRSAPQLRRGPHRSRPRSAGRRGSGSRAVVVPSGSSRSILLRTSSIGRSSAADLREDRVRPPRSARAAGPRAATRRRRGGSRSATSVSSSVEAKPCDELGRQPPDESDRVGHEVPLAVVLEAAGRRVERLEEAVLDRDLRSCERVQQRRLADVRVPGERDGRHLGSLALLPPRRPLRLESLEPLLAAA